MEIRGVSRPNVKGKGVAIMRKSTYWVYIYEEGTIVDA